MEEDWDDFEQQQAFLNAVKPVDSSANKITDGKASKFFTVEVR